VFSPLGGAGDRARQNHCFNAVLSADKPAANPLCSPNPVLPHVEGDRLDPVDGPDSCRRISHVVLTVFSTLMTSRSANFGVWRLPEPAFSKHLRSHGPTARPPPKRGIPREMVGALTRNCRIRIKADGCLRRIGPLLGQPRPPRRSLDVLPAVAPFGIEHPLLPSKRIAEEKLPQINVQRAKGRPSLRRLREECDHPRFGDEWGDENAHGTSRSGTRRNGHVPSLISCGWCRASEYPPFQPRIPGVGSRCGTVPRQWSDFFDDDPFRPFDERQQRVWRSRSA